MDRSDTEQWGRYDEPERSGLVQLANTTRVAWLAYRQRRIERWPAARLKRLQAGRVQAIVRHAYESVPFYREAMRARGLLPEDFRGPTDLARLPLIDAADLRADVERFTSVRVPTAARSISYTSGTQGKDRGIVFRDDGYLLDSLAKGINDRAMVSRLAGENALAALAREVTGSGPGGRAWARWLDPRGAHRRVSIFETSFAGSTARLGWSRRTLLSQANPTHRYGSASAPLEETVELFRAARPRIVFSFGSYADQFLRFAAFSGEDIPLPKLWAFVGDAVSDEGWRAASELDVRLWSEYAAVEAGRIGFQCEVGRGHHLHVHSCALRLVDSDGATLPAGEEGEIVTSNLLNRATVVLNYRIGDRGALAMDPCPCGRGLPLLATLSGRTGEFVQLADGRAVPLLVFDGMFRRELHDTLRSQVTQVGPGRIRWTVVPRPGAGAGALREALLRRARERAPGTQIDLVVADAIEPTPVGKLRRVVR